jgi:sugar (pentulose or hexulose) kinase
MKEVIAIFDIGKTNKKILLFDNTLQLVFQEEKKFDEIKDDDGFPCDDIEKIEKWMAFVIQSISRDPRYKITTINFTTYGGTLLYINENGDRLTPMYNYLKPMPEDVLVNFYDQYGGVEEFCRKTASPFLGMGNAGLQILWLKKKKPETFNKIWQILHFPQYLSYCFTGKVTCEYTSIGCHTTMWDFDKGEYHTWLSREQITLPPPVSNSMTIPCKINNHVVSVGIGIHDSSSSLVPYLAGSKDKFILISTGTWFIFMNPFNYEPLTADQLRKDTLCYLSVEEKQVKSSRLFMGHIHDVNVRRLSLHFKVLEDYFKQVKSNEKTLLHILAKNKQRHVFFQKGFPAGYVDEAVDLNQFENFDEAYCQFIFDITAHAVSSLKLVIARNDDTKVIYVSGGFSRNELFVRLLATAFPGKRIYTSEVDNATALGAALVLNTVKDNIIGRNINLGLKEASPYN